MEINQKTKKMNKTKKKTHKKKIERNAKYGHEKTKNRKTKN